MLATRQQEFPGVLSHDRMSPPANTVLVLISTGSCKVVGTTIRKIGRKFSTVAPWGQWELGTVSQSETTCAHGMPCLPRSMGDRTYDYRQTRCYRRSDSYQQGDVDGRLDANFEFPCTSSTEKRFLTNGTVTVVSSLAAPGCHLHKTVQLV